MCSSALVVIQFIHPLKHSPTEPFAAMAKTVPQLQADASLNAFGQSREVRLRFALPGMDVEFPLEVSSDPSALTYEWVEINSSSAGESARPLSGASFVAPKKPGFYHLVLLKGTERELLPEPTLAVMVPFTEKSGAMLNGYRMGTYAAERHANHDHPAGFLEVRESDIDLKITKHLKLGDFITHDRQGNVWPKYIALNPLLLDKLELVLQKIGEQAHLTQAAESDSLALDVHSGFRTPAHNQSVWRAVDDSRHEYGDAADVAIDANGDGRVTLYDELLVARAVDQVEAEHPELVGGLGLYTSSLYHTPYVHIDARGKRSRWKG
jgi:hypothetical protein